MESYTTSKHSTNTSTACDVPSIEVDTKEQVARHNQPNIYTPYTHENRQQNTQIQYPRHREKP